MAHIEPALERLSLDGLNTLMIDTGGIAEQELGGARLLARVAKHFRRDGLTMEYQVSDAQRSMIALVETVPYPDLLRRPRRWLPDGIGRRIWYQRREFQVFRHSSEKPFSVGIFTYSRDDPLLVYLELRADQA